MNANIKYVSVLLFVMTIENSCMLFSILLNLERYAKTYSKLLKLFLNVCFNYFKSQI